MIKTSQSSIRFSIGRFTTEEEVDFTIGVVREQVDRLRLLASEETERGSREAM
jgi:cysteine desulfurase